MGNIVKLVTTMLSINRSFHGCRANSINGAINQQPQVNVVIVSLPTKTVPSFWLAAVAVRHGSEPVDLFRTSSNMGLA